MANHSKFNKIIKRLEGRQFKCKTFYDYYWDPVINGKYEVYLKQEVDAVLKELREIYDNQEDEIVRQKRRAEDSELETYKFKHRIKKEK